MVGMCNGCNCCDCVCFVFEFFNLKLLFFVSVWFLI